jgi:hypothetical protein
MSDVESTDQTESNDPLWQVQLASGQVCRMTLELLDDAFQDGLITEDTLIMQDGTTEWVTLRQVAGLDSEGETAAAESDAASVATDDVTGVAMPTEPSGAPPAVEAAATETAPVAESPVVVASIAPAPQPVEAQVAVAPMQAPAAVAPAPVPVQPAAPAAYFDPFAPPIQVAPAAQMVPPAPAQAAPVAFQNAVQSVAPQVGYASAPDPMTRSMAPVAADIDFDLEAVNFGKKRSPAKWIIGIAAVLGGLGFAAMNMNTTEEAIPPAVAAPAQPAAPLAYEAIPATEPAPVTAAAKSDPTRLSDDAKRALLDADKTRSAKAHHQKANQPSRGGASSSGPRKKSDPFHKGGDKYDPLNASL